MRQNLWVLACAVLVLAGCGQSGMAPAIAGLGPGGNAAGNGGGGGDSTGTGTTIPLRVTPETAQILAGSTVQLSTNYPANSVQWRSLQSTTASVSPGGVVLGIAPGTAVIVVMASSDTTRRATAVITVIGLGTGTTTAPD